ncbi:phenylacetate--CoA ligase family protein [Neomoorella humiferrea]|uniref:Phenylacetate-coenzyme A ligase n=1 Tax=Neomoorella humiferrea TaxID=676965 RepID=A0A2T0ARQ6_9FIRM|nr:phenylacetate--CoA ligase [Moorella humiferrea]PRR72486.1 Phenylacetate-coenzyme A ligase [Moorella humiferrea]
MIWDSANECRPRAEIEALQLARLQETVARVYERVPFYRQAMDAKGIRPSDIRTLDDVRLLPMTTKDDFRRNYPYGLFAVPLKEVVRLHASSGTTGKPIVVGYTRRDLETWTDLVARLGAMAGVTADDVVQIVFGYGLFTGGFGLHYGMERLGATVVPASAGNSKRHIMLIQDFGTTVLVGTPSYVLHLAEVAEQEGINPRELPVRLGLFGGEASSREMLKEIERRWGMLATDNYGLSEVMGPGVSGECQYQDGQHVAEDHFLVEILDPVTGEPCPPGVKGEVVITTLTKEALPVLRYRTRDVSSLNFEPCRCGRTTARLAKITGRTDDMLIIRGVNVFPSQVESVLMEIEGVAPHYQLIVSRRNYLDELEIRVEVNPEFFSDRYRELEELEEKVADRLHTVLQLKARVRLVEPYSIPRSEGKARRVIDLRPK